MSYKLFPTQPTPQRVSAVLRAHLGAGGYNVFRLSMHHRTTRHDFVAVHKDNVNNFVVVRALRMPVQALPFGLVSNTLPARHIIERMRCQDKPVARIGPQIDLRRMNLRLEHFIRPDQHKEFGLLYPGIKLAA